MRLLIFSLLLVVATVLSAQTRSTSGWTDYGSSHISKWIQVAPGKMGPNALPVPDMDYARVIRKSAVISAAHLNVMNGDTSVSSYLSFEWAVVPEKVAVKVWGFPTETFRMNTQVRDERQIYYDDTGWKTTGGDLWISTFIQLLRHHNSYPDLTLNYSMKTTTGSILHARYTDAPAHYFYAAAGYSFYPGLHFLDELRLAAMAGIYIWQTNKVEMAQDEGPLAEAGVWLRHNSFSLLNEIGGYNGYGAYGYMGVRDHNFPVVYRAKLIKKGEYLNWNLEYKTGWNDFNYTTMVVGLTYNFYL